MKNIFIVLFFALSLIIVFLGHRFYIQQYYAEYRSAIGDMKNGSFASAKEKLLPYAIEGHSEARYYMGMIYAGGLGVDIDSKQAEEWFKCTDYDVNCTAGDNEYRISQDFLSGQFVKKDEDLSKYWLQIAKNKGYAKI